MKTAMLVMLSMFTACALDQELTGISDQQVGTCISDPIAAGGDGDVIQPCPDHTGTVRTASANAANIAANRISWHSSTPPPAANCSTNPDNSVVCAIEWFIESDNWIEVSCIWGPLSGLGCSTWLCEFTASGDSCNIIVID